MSAIGLQRVVSPAGVLPQAAERLHASAGTAPHEVRVRVERLNLDPAAALGAGGLAADVTTLIGNGYVPGHAELALDLVRTDPGVRMLFDARLAAD